MSLEISELNRFARSQYWNTKTAYYDIINAGNLIDEDSSLIRENDKMAFEILSDWVWASNYRSIRFALGKIPYIKQYACKRIYPTATMAKKALASEILSQDNWNKEASHAQKLMKNNQLKQNIFEISQQIYNYLKKKPQLQKICEAQSDYWHYAKLNYSAKNTWDLIGQVIQKKDTDLVTNIAIIHDLATLLKRVKKSQVTNFTSFDSDILMMSILSSNKERQVLPANQIFDPNKGQPTPMRWTLSGGKFPDNRTPNEDHPAVIYARMYHRPVQMGPSRTTAIMLHLAREALNNSNKQQKNIEDLLAHLTLGLFAFWNQSYNRRCTMIHCYHFVTDCAVHNFSIPRKTINKIMGLSEQSDYL